MPGIEIHDKRATLGELIQAVEDSSDDYVWICTNVLGIYESGETFEAGLEVIGGSEAVFEQLAEDSTELTTKELAELSLATCQVIWGEFWGKEKGKEEASVLVCAEDGGFWTAYGEARSIERVSKQFDGVRPARFFHLTPGGEPFGK